MAVSYNGLWKLLIDKNMKKVDMMNQVGISSSTVAKMTNGEFVSMKVLEKICEKLDCDFGDIVHYERKPQGGCVHEQVAERIANVRFTKERNLCYGKDYFGFCFRAEKRHFGTGGSFL